MFVLLNRKRGDSIKAPTVVLEEAIAAPDVALQNDHAPEGGPLLENVREAGSFVPIRIHFRRTERLEEASES